MKNKPQKITSIILMLALIAGCFVALPLLINPTSAQDVSGTWSISDRNADDITNPENIADGTVWTDKSVTTNTDGSFDITLSAFGRRWSMEREIYLERYKPINVVFVLDTSSSMLSADLSAMLNATKQAGNMILNANPNNTVAVVYYDNTARQANPNWLWVNPNNVKTTLDTLTLPSTVSATNIVAGLNLAKTLLDNAPNKNTAEPVIVLMTDGAPNRYIDTNGRVAGNGGATGDATSVSETIKKASQITATGVSIYTVGYNINSNPLAWIVLNPSNNVGFLAPGITLRAINVDWQSTSGSNLNTLRFQTSGTTVDIANAHTISGLGHTNAAINYFKYNTKFYAPLQPQQLIDSFKEVVNDITTDIASPIKAGENLVITDVIGEGFEFDVAQLNGLGPAVTYDTSTHTITWTVPASQLYLFDPSNWHDGNSPYSSNVAKANMNKITFVVTAIGEPLPKDIDNYNGEKYYTNNFASSQYVNYNADLIIQELTNNGWVKYNFVPNTADYTIEYYYNGVLDITKTETSTATIGNVINTYPDKTITGYTFDSAENFPLTISANVVDNVIRVYYVTDPCQTLSYTVEYYFNGVKDDALTDSLVV
ncbi:MAG: VWA domain-containing protein, partial [Nitrososphaerota archaeon]|nr:VWA domain-containing protein [Nitrososphaerota archaeon]